MRFKQAVTAVAVSMFLAGTAAAAQGGPEITVGLAAVSIISGDGESATLIGVNNQTVRLGFPISPGAVLEPSLSISHFSSDGASATTLGLGALVPLYFGGNTTQGVYIGPGAALQYTSFDAGPFASGSTSQLALMFEVGNKSRISDAVALRLGANVSLGLENEDIPSSTTISGIIGLTVQLR